MFPNAKFIYLMRNPYTVFESTRSFFTNTIQPLKLQDISNEELQENILSVYAKLYHKYEADKKFIPEGNLVEVRFEDYETNAFDMTQEIYQNCRFQALRTLVPTSKLTSTKERLQEKQIPIQA